MSKIIKKTKVGKQNPTRKEKISMITKKVTEIVNEKKSGMAIVFTPDKTGMLVTSVSHEFTHADGHHALKVLNDIVHPESGELEIDGGDIMSLLNKLAGGSLGKIKVKDATPKKKTAAKKVVKKVTKKK